MITVVTGQRGNARCMWVLRIEGRELGIYETDLLAAQAGVGFMDSDRSIQRFEIVPTFVRHLEFSAPRDGKITVR